MSKPKSFRFKDSLYEQFKAACETSNISITKAFEKLMELFLFDDGTFVRVVTEAKRHV